MIRAISLVGIVFGLATIACTQESRGVIQGTVKDPQGSLVVGATVSVTKTATATISTLKTNESGRYSAPLLLPGDYTVTVEATGFKKAVQQGIQLLTGDVRTVDITLQLGDATEHVTVTAEAPIVDATQTYNGTALDDRTVRDLPVMTDVVTSMIQFAPGVNAGFSALQISAPIPPRAAPITTTAAAWAATSGPSTAPSATATAVTPPTCRRSAIRLGSQDRRQHLRWQFRPLARSRHQHHDQVRDERFPWRRKRELLEPAMAGQQPVHQAGVLQERG